MGTAYTSGSWLVREGHEGDFVAAWTAFAEWAGGHGGAGTLRLVRDVEHARRFLSFAPWASLAAQQAWKDDPEFRQRIGRVREHCEDFVPSTYELVAEVEPGS